MTSLGAGKDLGGSKCDITGTKVELVQLYSSSTVARISAHTTVIM